MGAAGASPDRSRRCRLLPRPGLPVPEAQPGRGTWGIRAAGAGRTEAPSRPSGPPARTHAARAFAVAGQRPRRHRRRLAGASARSPRRAAASVRREIPGLEARTRGPGRLPEHLALLERLPVPCQALHARSLL